MKSAERIKAGLQYCGNGGSCRGCAYRCDYVGELRRDALEYIKLLESKCSRLIGQCVAMRDAFKEAKDEIEDGKNCSNCAYGDGSNVYCLDCLWYINGATRIKWTKEKHDGGIC